MRRLLILAFVLALACPANASNLQNRLNTRWRGAWVLVKFEISSDCGGTYTNNRVSGALARGGGHHRLPAGELVQVYKIDVKRNRLDMLVDVEERLLVLYEDGPFTLYDEVHCKVELEIETSERAKGMGLERLENLLAENLERHDRREDAYRSPEWNRRKRQPFPEDYEETVARYREWKADEINREFQRRLDDALEQASRLLGRVDEAPEFGAGMAHGMELMAGKSLPYDCDQLLASSFHTYHEDAGDQSSDAWEDGFDLGQDLAYHVELARRLRQCYVRPEDIDV